MNLSRISGIFLLIASISVLVLTTVAMFTYPGSAPHHLKSTRYEFTQNTFSDLGTTKTYRGEQNEVSRLLFTTSLILVGVGLTIFGWTQSKLFTKGTSKSFRIASAVTATISGIGFIGIALTPSNLYYPLHIDALNVAFSFLLAFTITTVFIQRQAHWKKKYILANYIFIALLGGYILMLFFGPRINTPIGLTTQVISQKIIAYAAILNITYQALGETRKNKIANKYKKR